MELITVNINGRNWTGELADSSMPLQWMLRDIVGLGETARDCAHKPCGGCVVLADGELEDTCAEEVTRFIGRRVVTIEGLADLPAAGSSGITGCMLQEMWQTTGRPQCESCSPAVLLALYALLRVQAAPAVADIDNAIRNVCACAPYAELRNGLLARLAPRSVAV